MEVSNPVSAQIASPSAPYCPQVLNPHRHVLNTIRQCLNRVQQVPQYSQSVGSLRYDITLSSTSVRGSHKKRENHLERSVGAETFTIVSTSKYNSLIEYELDPSTLSGLTHPNTMIFEMVGFRAAVLKKYNENCQNTRVWTRGGAAAFRKSVASKVEYVLILIPNTSN